MNENKLINLRTKLHTSETSGKRDVILEERLASGSNYNTADLSVSEEDQIKLLYERFTAIHGVGSATASKIVDLLIVEGISEVSPEAISDITQVDRDVAEKIWLYISGLHDGVEEEFE